MLNPSDYGVASPQEILKDTSQGSQATNLHWQVSANLTIRVRRYLGLAYRAKGSSSFASKVRIPPTQLVDCSYQTYTAN
jgi:hypothetical protein